MTDAVRDAEAQPVVGNFWFIGRESATGDPPPSVLVAYLEPIDGSTAPSPEAAAEAMARAGQKLYRGPDLYADEVWPLLREAYYPLVRWRNRHCYPHGSVSWCAADGSALILIDPSINDPALRATWHPAGVARQARLAGPDRGARRSAAEAASAVTRAATA